MSPIHQAQHLRRPATNCHSEALCYPALDRHSHQLNLVHHRLRTSISPVQTDQRELEH